ncbi:MAG: radical SAM protein [Candidatus Thermoplasmatota archaeon]
MQISEIFRSLQGEGAEIGLPTVFVRTAGCNLRCEWCDTKYGWEDGEEMSVKEIKEEIEDFSCERVCITGGEPLLQDDLNELMDLLLPSKHVTVETNGSLSIKELVDRRVKVSMDYKTPSSQMTEEMDCENLGLLRKDDQLKFVIADEEDYEFSSNLLQRNEVGCETIFQPVDNQKIRQIAEWVLDDGLDVRVLPQLHKIIWGDKREV